MVHEHYNVIGVMSGTSLDGIDLAHITLSLKDKTWSYTIHNAQTIPYSKNWIEKLKNAVEYSPELLDKLNCDYTALLGSVIKKFISAHGISQLTAVCSHGHTILHQPQAGITLQIGNLPEIAQIAGVKVICDFRVQDVALGGQGAPLVPIGDKLLFSNYEYCLNLGGFSNISFDENGKRLAYDICPVNTVLNFYAEKSGYSYDDGGRMAATGKILPLLLRELNKLEFYSAPYPKSLGFEFVKNTVLPLMQKHQGSVPDMLRTFIEHIATQIAKSISGHKLVSLLITGGGAYNTYLLQRLRILLPGIEITVPDIKTIEYKEALIFALLGILRLKNEVNVLHSVTGATHSHCAGYIYEP